MVGSGGLLAQKKDSNNDQYHYLEN